MRLNSHEPSEELAVAAEYLADKLEKLESEMRRLAAMEQLMLASPDQQISLTDPDSRSMATNGRVPSVVGYNVQVAVDAPQQDASVYRLRESGGQARPSQRSQTPTTSAISGDSLAPMRDDSVSCPQRDRALHLEKLGQTGEQVPPHLIQIQVP